MGAPPTLSSLSSLLLTDIQRRAEQAARIRSSDLYSYTRLSRSRSYFNSMVGAGFPNFSCLIGMDGEMSRPRQWGGWVVVVDVGVKNGLWEIGR